MLSVAHLVSRIVQLNPSSDSTLSNENATSYSLCCAVCAAITRQLTFLTTGNPIVGVPPNIDASEYAKESIRARNLYDYRLEPSHDNLLISFFLYIYYVNIKGGIQAAILYMKEAISIAQLLGLHDPRTYSTKTTAEVHRLRKIYYMLLVTERFMCIEDNVPVCLEPSIPLPSLEDEEYSGLLTGFIELVKVFSIPDKKFFDNLINYSKKNPSNLQNFHNLFASSGAPTRKWIINVQAELKKIEIDNASSDTQRLNIILSKHWMRSLAWHISSQNGLLIKKAKTPEEFCLTSQFPIEIARDFLIGTEQLPIFAFESNGPGVCVKLLEIALAVADSVNECIVNKLESFTAYNILTSVFTLVSKFKSDITISKELYSKVENIVNKKSTAVSPVYTKSYIREINDDGESIHSDESSKANSVDPAHEPQEHKEVPLESFHEKDMIQSEFKYFDPSIHIPSIVHSPNHSPNSPFTQMQMAFSMSPLNQMNFDQEYLGFRFQPGSTPPGPQPQPQQGQALSLGQAQPQGQVQDKKEDHIFQSHQLFQTFHQTLSPSAEQLQQLEMQLQHQFSQFHQNQYKQYQYGSPSTELPAGPGRGNGTPGFPDNFRMKSPDTLLNETNMALKNEKSPKKDSNNTTQTPTTNSETIGSDETISKSNSKSDPSSNESNENGSNNGNSGGSNGNGNSSNGGNGSNGNGGSHGNSGSNGSGGKDRNESQRGHESQRGNGSDGPLLFRNYAPGPPTSTFPVDASPITATTPKSEMDKPSLKPTPRLGVKPLFVRNPAHSPRDKKFGSPIYSEASSYASTYSGSDSIPEEMNFNEHSYYNPHMTQNT